MVTLKEFRETKVFSYSGVYIIQDIESNRSYIGSSKNIRNRIIAHLSSLKKLKHSNCFLQNHYNAYGDSHFTFDCLEQTSISDLLNREQYYLNLYKPEFNIAKSAFSVMAGRKHSEKTRNKLIGRSSWNKGIPRTEQEKKLMSLRKKEEYAKKDDNYKKWLSEIRKKNPSKYWLGKKVPDSVRKQLQINAKLKSQRILCLNNNKIYESQLSAAVELNIKQGHISEVLNKKRLSAKGYKFIYA